MFSSCRIKPADTFSDTVIRSVVSGMALVSSGSKETLALGMLCPHHLALAWGADPSCLLENRTNGAPSSSFTLMSLLVFKWLCSHISHQDIFRNSPVYVLITPTFQPYREACSTQYWVRNRNQVIGAMGVSVIKGQRAGGGDTGLICTSPQTLNREITPQHAHNMEYGESDLKVLHRRLNLAETEF